MGRSPAAAAPAQRPAPPMSGGAVQQGPRPPAASAAPMVGPQPPSALEMRQRAMGRSPGATPPAQRPQMPAVVQPHQQPSAAPMQQRMRMPERPPVDTSAPMQVGPQQPSAAEMRRRALGQDRGTYIPPQPQTGDRRLPRPDTGMQPRPHPDGNAHIMPRRDRGNWDGRSASAPGGDRQNWRGSSPGFERPLHGDRSTQWRGHERGGYERGHHHHHHHHAPAPRRRTSLSISIGAHFGPTYIPPPVYVSNPFVYYSTVYCAPRYRAVHPVYVSPVYYPYYVYPSYSHVYYSYPRHSFSIGFGSGSFRSHHSWLYHYSFSHVPSYHIAHTTLVRPAVVHVVQPTTTILVPTSSVASSGWFGAESVGTSVSNDRVGVVLPEPRQAEYPSVQAEQPRLTTGAELGMTYVQLGDAESALRVLIHHLSDYPNDTEAIRGVALAYLLLGEGENGVRQIGRAYRLSPWLAARPLPRGFLAPEDHAYALDVATNVAAQQRSPDAWLAVAVLMQAEERYSAARSAIDRARAAGLDQQVVDRFMGTLPADPGY